MSRYEEKFAKLEPAERLEARIHHVLPLVDAFFAYLKSKEGSVAPKSATGKAVSYCMNQEEYLRVFLTDGYVPMTNNAAERSIRPFTVGRNNWFQIDTVSGAKASAIAYSIAETAKANQLKPYEYFRYLLEELSKHGELEDLSYVEELLPWSETLPRNAATRKRELKTDQVCLYLPSIKGGIIFSQVLAMEHLLRKGTVLPVLSSGRCRLWKMPL